MGFGSAALILVISSMFVSNFRYEKGNVQQEFNPDRLILDRLGYRYKKGDNFEELDTGNVLAKTISTEHTQQTWIHDSRYSDSSEVGCTEYTGINLESTIRYVDEDHIEEIVTDNQSISFQYDDDMNLTIILLNKVPIYEKNILDDTEYIMFSNHTERI